MKQGDAVDLDGRDLGACGDPWPIGSTAFPPSSERQVRMKRPLVPPDAGSSQAVGYLVVQIDGGAHPGNDVQVEHTRRATRRKGTESPKSDPEGLDGNVPCHQVGDSPCACLGDLTDEYEREVHLFRPDQPQLSPVSSERVDRFLLLPRDRGPRWVGEFDGGEQTQREPGICPVRSS